MRRRRTSSTLNGPPSSKSTVEAVALEREHERFFQSTLVVVAGPAAFVVGVGGVRSSWRDDKSVGTTRRPFLRPLTRHSSKATAVNVYDDTAHRGQSHQPASSVSHVV